MTDSGAGRRAPRRRGARRAGDDGSTAGSPSRSSAGCASSTGSERMRWRRRWRHGCVATADRSNCGAGNPTSSGGPNRLPPRPGRRDDGHCGHTDPPAATGRATDRSQQSEQHLDLPAALRRDVAHRRQRAGPAQVLHPDRAPPRPREQRPRQRAGQRPRQGPHTRGDRRPRARQADRGHPGGRGHGRRLRPGPLQGPPRLGGPCARDDLPRCSPRLAKAVADARTHIPGRRKPLPTPGSMLRR